MSTVEDPKRQGGGTGETGFSERDRAFVMQLWDDARTARLSELYYGRRIQALSRTSFWTEILIAGTATGSGIAGWAVWQHAIGEFLWATIAGAAATLAIAKPLMNLDRQLTSCTKQQQVYRNILSSLEYIVFDIQQAAEIKAEHRDRYRRSRDLLMQAQAADDSTPSAPLVRKLYDKVNQEMPADSFWVPLSANVSQAVAA